MTDALPYIRVRSFIAVIREPSAGLRPFERKALEKVFTRPQSSVSSDFRLEVIYEQREGDRKAVSASTCAGTLVLGDDSEWGGNRADECMAYGAAIRFDTGKKTLRILTSIVGLPPVFVCRCEGMTILTSDIYLVPGVTGKGLKFDKKGIADLFTIGHPVEHRTLFEDVAVAPCGSSIEYNGGSLRIESAWDLPGAARYDDWDAFTGLQMRAFEDALENMDLSQSFLSLTAGLDTRTILAYLARKGLKLPTITMCGEGSSLDSMTAERLCKAYGFEFKTIFLGKEFYGKLPELTLEASKLSGGVLSMDQATEVFFFRHMGPGVIARLNGNLGNQVGRGGMEKISMRGLDESILSNEIRRNTVSEHWYSRAKSLDGRLDFKFLLQNEVPFSSMGNYSIGNHYAIQQSPYANARLIGISGRAPLRSKEAGSPSLIRMRLKDLNHRFFGEPERTSFQRRYIKETGGFVAECPINWGWRARGGVSVPGLLNGVLALTDAYVASKHLSEGVLGLALKKGGILGLHEYKYFSAWIRTHLKAFIGDTLGSRGVRESGIFDRSALEKLTGKIDEPMEHQKELIFALDVACAQQVFMAGL